ncbi:MAG: hypothetical protein EON56_05590, partial [Alphaproteobacteria bacterium]
MAKIEAFSYNLPPGVPLPSDALPFGDSIPLVDSLTEQASSPSAPSQPPKALPRYRRAPEQAPPITLTRRDIRLLEDIWRFGLLTTSQIETLRQKDEKAELRFASRLTLTRRLKLLFHHRYVRRLPRPLAAGSQEPVYVLDHNGARVLSLQHGQVTARAPSRLPKTAALDHLLEVVQFRVAITASPFSASPSAAFIGDNMRLQDWLPGDKVRFRVPVETPGERRQIVSIIPDAGLVIRSNGMRHYFFLEVDRGTEAGRILTAKGVAYVSYWKNGGFARDFGVPVGMGFRILLVAPTPARAQ